MVWVLKAYNTALCVGLHHNLVESSRFFCSGTLELLTFTLHDMQNPLEFCRNSFALHNKFILKLCYKLNDMLNDKITVMITIVVIIISSLFDFN